MASRFWLLFACGGLVLFGQAKPGPDEIVFVNGDRLAGHFVRATGANVVFKSDVLGDLTIDWKKVKQLHTTQKVAVIRKNVKLKKKKENVAAVPEGTLAMEDQKLQLTPTPPQSPQPIPVGDAAVALDSGAFEKAMTTTPSLIQDWKGTVTLGASLVQATQNSRTFTGAISLIRAEPSENWLDPANRTAFDFSESYGEVTQPITPTIKTSIFHADAQRDEYFTKSLYVFGEGAFDHNYSQGLDLQQTYAGGIGWTAVKSANQELDLKASMSYIRQQFVVGPNLNLVGSVFAENYSRKLGHLTLDQNVSATPAWNNTNAYSWLASGLLTMPVYKRLSASTGVTNTFLNDPPPDFKKNSFQFMLGLTFAIQ
jgi:hypothetical protein